MPQWRLRNRVRCVNGSAARAGWVGEYVVSPSSRVIPDSAFTGLRFPAEVIVLAVRWHLRYGRSYGDVEELLAERGVGVDHVTVYR